MALKWRAIMNAHSYKKHAIKFMGRLFRYLPLHLLAMTAIAGPVAADFDVVDPDAAGWGTTPLDFEYYPDTSWEQGFSVQPDVQAAAGVSIKDAIARCDQVVGTARYCVVQITDSASREPVVISRSHTKIIGTDGMTPLLAHRGENTLTVAENTKHIVIEGLELQGQSTGFDDIFGIVVDGKNIDGVVIRNNHIHHYESDSQAHGIAVFGRGGVDETDSSVRNVLITYNYLHDMKTGGSESIVVNGNVENWAIDGNTVENVNNIAIDAIGGEATSPIGTDPTGRKIPGPVDVARHGFILNNTVNNVNTVTNAAYDYEDTWASAIYVDGGSWIRIAGNTIDNAAWAFEIGAENCLTTSHISVLYNEANNSRLGDLLLGGYEDIGYLSEVGIESVECNPEDSEDPSEGHGYVSRVWIEGNAFNSINTEEQNILPQNRLRGAVILQDGVNAENTHLGGLAPGDENAIVVQEP